MPQFETPRTTPFCSRTILPAVLAILKIMHQYEAPDMRIHIGGGGAYSFTSERRPGRTCICQPPFTPSSLIAEVTHHSYHLIQHLDLLVGVAVAVALFPSRKVVAFGKRSRALPIASSAI